MKNLRALLIILAATAMCWATPPKPWHFGVAFAHDFYRGQGLSGANLSFGRDLSGHFAIEGNLADTATDKLTFAYIGSANQVVFSPGSLDRLRANVLGAFFTTLGPMRLTAEAGPEFDRFGYQGVSSRNLGAFYYGLGLSAYRGDWGVRVHGGESLFTPVAGGGHAHIWEVTIGPTFRW